MESSASSRDPVTARQSSDSARRVDGHVVRGTRTGSVPVAGSWVVVHRVGTDRSGPLDSTRTDGAGRFSLHYKTSGDTSAVYFVSTSYGGVAYFSRPLREPVVSGDDGTLMVFDTTSRAFPIAIAGRHVIVSTPDANGRRSVGEVYELQNDSALTLVARDSTAPVWSAHVPAGALSLDVNPSGDIAAGAVAHAGSAVQLFAPLSPGLRQFAFSYDLPAKAFPLLVPAEQPIGVLELLVQERMAHVSVSGVNLREMAPVSPDGRVFRRFLARDVPPGSVVQIEVPRVIGAERERGVRRRRHRARAGDGCGAGRRREAERTSAAVRVGGWTGDSRRHGVGAVAQEPRRAR